MLSGRRNLLKVDKRHAPATLAAHSRHLKMKYATDEQPAPIFIAL